ncbi:MAG TPA: glycosyltransferase family 4 protein [Phycisphaerales bacterium]|nr:glycosyltransferase family 4 protein [Phycisphaerales bacterium]HMP38096.1 glycosyltransferase family 4 protein [Phycisphaerales bacterium]
MRILQYLSRFRSRDGGVPRAVVDLVALLAARGHEVRLLTGGDDMLPAAWRTGDTEGIRIVDLSPWGRLGRTTASDRRQIEDAVRWSDCVHLHVPWDRRHRRFLAASGAALRPVILTAHGMLDARTIAHRALRKRCFLALGGRAALESATFVHCNSPREIELSRASAPRARFRATPLATELAPILALSPKAAPSVPPRLLALGRLDPIKGLEQLLGAVALLKSRGRSARLEIAGSGPEAYAAALRARSAALGLEEIVTFHGQVDGAGKLALLAQADCLVHASVHENFGVAIIEAMAAGLPVVMTTGVNLAETLVESGGAIAVPPGDLRSLAEGIEASIADPATLRRRGDAARAWVRRALDPAVIAREYEAMYAAAIEARGRRE